MAEAGSSSTSVKINMGEVLADGFFTGCTFLLLDNPDNRYEILDFDSGKSEIRLSEAIEIKGGERAFEIQSPEEAPVLAARLITKTAPGRKFPAMELRLSTTKGTNALLERKGAKTLFLITKGFRDLLHISNQQRPELFALNIRKSEPFYRHIVEVPERIDAEGNIIKPLDKDLLKERIKPHSKDTEAAGICLMNSYRNSVS